MTPSSTARTDAVAEWKQLTEVTLPALAKQHHWPLRLDHCFKRVCLDHACGDVWYHHLKKPAERHMEDETLQRALDCARSIAAAGEPLLRQRNEESLRYRGKGRYAAAARPL